jgi:transcription termination factor Rho
MFEIETLKAKKLADLQEIAATLKIARYKTLKKQYKQPEYEFEGIIESEGVLDIMSDGYGFLRSSDYNYLASPDDIYVLNLKSAYLD